MSWLPIRHWAPVNYLRVRYLVTVAWWRGDRCCLCGEPIKFWARDEDICAQHIEDAVDELKREEAALRR